MSLVDDALSVWEATRNGVISEIDLVDEAQLDYRLNPAARSIREIGLHVAGHGVGFTNELLAPETNFGNLFTSPVKFETHSKAELLELLRTTGQETRERLKARGDQLITDTQASRLSKTGTMSRLSGLWFAIGHESHHRGQLTAYLRGIGVTPALTQQLVRR
jgi:uncharacterized damage-inducible protein DinB